MTDELDQSRRIAMDEATAAILADHWERCYLRAAVYGCELEPDGYVFSLARTDARRGCRTRSPAA